MHGAHRTRLTSSRPAIDRITQDHTSISSLFTHHRHRPFPPSWFVGDAHITADMEILPSSHVQMTGGNRDSYDSLARFTRFLNEKGSCFMLTCNAAVESTIGEQCAIHTSLKREHTSSQYAGEKLQLSDVSVEVG